MKKLIFCFSFLAMASTLEAHTYVSGSASMSDNGNGTSNLYCLVAIGYVVNWIVCPIRYGFILAGKS